MEEFYDDAVGEMPGGLPVVPLPVKQARPSIPEVPPGFHRMHGTAQPYEPNPWLAEAITRDKENRPRASISSRDWLTQEELQRERPAVIRPQGGLTFEEAYPVGSAARHLYEAGKQGLMGRAYGPLPAKVTVPMEAGGATVNALGYGESGWSAAGQGLISGIIEAGTDGVPDVKSVVRKAVGKRMGERWHARLNRKRTAQTTPAQATQTTPAQATQTTPAQATQTTPAQATPAQATPAQATPATSRLPFIRDPNSPRVSFTEEVEDFVRYYAKKTGIEVEIPQLKHPRSHYIEGRLPAAEREEYLAYLARIDDLANHLGLDYDMSANVALGRRDPDRGYRSPLARFMYGSDVGKGYKELAEYRKTRKLINDITEPNEIVAIGSAGIGTEGTLHRPAVLHDLDFSGYVDGASRRTGRTKQDVDEMVAKLKDRNAIENSPVIKKLREKYPHLRDAKFRYAKRPWQWHDGTQYNPGYFTVPLPEPSVSNNGAANMLVTTQIDGVNVDIMLSDGALTVSKNNPRFGSAEGAFDWKRTYANTRLGHQMRPKDAVDIAEYRPYGPDNPRADKLSGRVHFGYDILPDDLVDPETGYPTIFQVETYPGSGEMVNAIANTRGEILVIDHEATTPLAAYGADYVSAASTRLKPTDPFHLSGNGVTPETHPLIAMRRRVPSTTAKMKELGIDFEPAPHIGLYPAHNPEALWSGIVNNNSGFLKDADVVLYNKMDVDPRIDVRNLVFDDDAVTQNTFPAEIIADYEATGLNNPTKARGFFDSKIKERFGRINRYARDRIFLGTDSIIVHPDHAIISEFTPEFREYMRRKNPIGSGEPYKRSGGTSPDISSERSSFNFSEALPLRNIPDRFVLTWDEIQKDPVNAKAKFMRAVNQLKFGIPMLIGGGAAVLGAGAEGDE